MGRVPHRCLAGHRAGRRGLGTIRLRARPYPVDEALDLERAAGLSRPVSTILTRRGISTAAEAEIFLGAGESHDPYDFSGMEDAVDLILGAVRAGRRTTIYGDFDCDGVCATSILVGGLRELGADCDWFIPDRIADGYGLNPDAIRRLAERGSSLVITVDCGVTAVEEVALARDLGMDMVVTDHHQADPVLPDCPILHPVISEYPFPYLCGAAVAAKLASALRRKAGVSADRDEADLDLVGLATVTDVMPLKGENRHLVREGVKVARRARRVGLAALMASSKTEPTRLVSEDFGFRIGPRINAAGRLYRADAGVELFLADSKERAAEIADELAAVNAERRRVEQSVESDARAELKDQGEPGPAVVVAGEGWHPGVVGIVASKLVKATGRPSVVIALDGDKGRGSARSVPGLDLHSAIGDAAGLLETFGGHAAAAGLGIRKENIEAFRQALGAAVEERIGTEPLEPTIEYDVVAGGEDLGLELAEELEKLQPFGNGNPAVKLLIPGARIEDLREMGEGKHCRFSVCSGSSRANAVAFGRTSFGLAEGEKADVVAELGINHWNGSIDPQLRVSEVLPVGGARSLAGCESDEWWSRFEFAMEFRFETPELPDAAVELASTPQGLPGVALAGLISSGERLLVLVADARQRWSGLGGDSLARFIPDLPERAPDEAAVAGIWAGSPAQEIEAAPASHVLLTDYESILPGPGGFSDKMDPSRGFDRIALLDPPYRASSIAWLSETGLPVHLLAGPEETAFSARVASHHLDLTAQLRDLFRGLRDAGAIDGGEITGNQLLDVLSRDSNSSRSAEQAAILLRVLLETGLARTEGVGSARRAGVVSSGRTDLSASAVFVGHISLYKEHERFLNHLNRQAQNQ